VCNEYSCASIVVQTSTRTAARDLIQASIRLSLPIGAQENVHGLLHACLCTTLVMLGFATMFRAKGFRSTGNRKTAPGNWGSIRDKTSVPAQLPGLPQKADSRMGRLLRQAPPAGITTKQKHLFGNQSVTGRLLENKQSVTGRLLENKQSVTGRLLENNQGVTGLCPLGPCSEKTADRTFLRLAAALCGDVKAHQHFV